MYLITKCLAGFSNIWRIAKLKVIGEIKFGKWIDFGHKDTIYKLKLGWLKFGESQKTHQIRQTFPLLYVCICVHNQTVIVTRSRSSLISALAKCLEVFTNLFIT